MKALIARLAGWGQFGITCLDQALTNHGIPRSAHDWIAILGSTAVAFALHFAAGTDGTK